MLFCQFSENFKFKELGTVIGIVSGSRAHAVSKRYGNIIFVKNLAYLVEMGIKEAFGIMKHAPLSHDRTTT